VLSLQPQDDTEVLTDFRIRVYGASGSSVKSGIKAITSVDPGNEAVHTKETGRVSVRPEIYETVGCGGGCHGGWGGGGGEGEIFCFILIAAMMAVFTVVWTVVMIVFSIVTIGGFLRRRYRTLVSMDRENKEFIGKLSVFVGKRSGVLHHPLGDPQYDNWVEDTFGLFMKLKYLRQVSLSLAFGWGFIEVAFKLYQVILDPSFDYYLWPFRYVMIAIFAPLIFYSPVLEMKFREAFKMGEEMTTMLVHRESSFNPDHPMTFEEEPKAVNK